MAYTMAYTMAYPTFCLHPFMKEESTVNWIFHCTLIYTYFTAEAEVVSLSCLFNIVVSPENIFSSTVAILESMEDMYIQSYLGIDNNKTLGFVISFTKKNDAYEQT